MKLWLAAFLYFGIPIVAGMVLVYVYVVITGDEYGEKLLPLAEQESLYPFGKLLITGVSFGIIIILIQQFQNKKEKNKI